MEKKTVSSPDLQNQLLSSILDSSTEYGIIATDMDDRIVFWNCGAELIYGYTHDEMVGKQTPMNLHKNDPLDNDILFLNGNTFRSNVIDRKMKAIRKDGSILPVSITVTPRTDASGTALGFVIIIRDITRLLLHEQFRDVLLEASYIVNSSTGIDDMCHMVINSISNLMDIPVMFTCIYDSYTNCLSVNSYAGLCNTFQHGSCKCCLDASVQRSEKCYLTATELTINSGNIHEHPVCEYIQNDDISPWDTSIIHIPLVTDTNLLGILHLAVDTERKNFLLSETQILSLIANAITAGIQRKRLEEENLKYADNLEKMVHERTIQLREKDAQLVQSGKLATLGEMAAGIAHEINQPLGGISLMVQGLLIARQRGKLNDEMLSQKLNSIIEQIERINKIITHLRTFARQSGDVKQEVNINAPLSDVFELIGQQFKNRGIDFNLDLALGLPNVLGDHNKFEQVFLNLISNAGDALNDFEPTVESLKKQIPPPHWALDWNKKLTARSYFEKGLVVVEITDNAGGIPKSLINKIFDPFFTTKEVGKGTGLGLSITYGIVKEFGGTIEVETQEMKGSRFVVKFPGV